MMCRMNSGLIKRWWWWGEGLINIKKSINETCLCLPVCCNGYKRKCETCGNKVNHVEMKCYTTVFLVNEFLLVGMF